MKTIRDIGFLLFFVFGLFLLGCYSNNDSEDEYTTLQQLEGKKIGIPASSVNDQLLNSKNKNIKDFVHFDNLADGILALKAKKIDGYVTYSPVLELACQLNKDLTILPEVITRGSIGFAFKKGNSLLKDRFAAVINALRNNGTLAKLKEKWMGNDYSKKTIPEQTWDNPNGIIKFGAIGNLEPMIYVDGTGKTVGYDIDVVMLAAKELGMHVDIGVYNLTGGLSALEAGKVDLAAGGLIITEERKKTIDMIKYYDGEQVVLIRKASNPNNKPDNTRFTEDLKASFERTFIVENRWKLIVNGLGITVLISVCSGILGSIIGFCLCMLRRTKNRVIDKLTFAFIRIIQGIPAIVFLMILYYVVFGKIDISPITVSIIGFSIIFGAYVSEMMRTGIEAVDIGQNEAALALGYSNVQSFFKVIFPQAAKHFLPVMKGEFIGMVKMTSIVGYIAGQDLTKATDIIRARTMEAFFPLIVTAIIYFVIANLMTSVITKYELKISRKNNKRL